MSDQLLTKCPHCSTTFRLSQQQLDIAGGAVRCGACYQVFHASEHIVKTAVVEETVPAPQEAPDPFQEFENPGAAEGMSSDTDPYDTNDWDTENHPDADLFADNYHEKMDDAENELADFGYDDDKKKPESNDEAWAEQLLGELEEDAELDDDETPDLIQDDPDEDNEHQSNTGFGSISSSESAFSGDLETKDDDATGANELSSSFSALDNWNEDDPFAISDNEEEAPLGGGAVDESWAQAMLSELEEESSPVRSIDQLEILEEQPEEESPFASKNLSTNIPPVKRKTNSAKKPTGKDRKENNKVANNGGQKDNAPKDDRLFESEDFFSQIDPEHDIDDIELGAMPELLEDDDSDILLSEDDLGPDPQDVIDHQIAASAAHFGIEDEPKSGSFVKSAALVLLNLLALVALCGQYVYFQYDDLARNNTYRPLFKTFCEKTGCTLPLKSDVSQIRGTNLVVRTHALEKNALVIDAIVYNRATFSQPFPVIELRFDDINGSAVASRRFKPSEYVHDSLIDLNNMPSDTPVHLTLEIVDPGQSAVNYRMNFYPIELPAS